MIEAAQIPGWDTAKGFLIEIHSPFEAVCRANQKNNWLIARKEAYTGEKKVQKEERIVLITGMLAQFCDLRSKPPDGLMAA
jgi:hypothetical protein